MSWSFLMFLAILSCCLFSFSPFWILVIGIDWLKLICLFIFFLASDKWIFDLCSIHLYSFDEGGMISRFSVWITLLVYLIVFFCRHPQILLSFISWHYSKYIKLAISLFFDNDDFIRKLLNLLSCCDNCLFEKQSSWVGWDASDLMCINLLLNELLLIALIIYQNISHAGKRACIRSSINKRRSKIE